MFVRVSTAAIKPGREADVRATIARLEQSMNDLEGIRHWVSFVTDDGQLTVLATYDTKVDGHRTANINRTRWEAVADLFEDKPRVVEGEVLALVNMT